MTQFKQITPRKWRNDETGVLVVRDDDKKTWCVRNRDGLPTIYLHTGNAKRFRSFDNALQHGKVIVNRILALQP